MKNLNIVGRQVGKMFFSRSEVESASDNAVILVEGDRAFIVEREPDGGIVHPAASEKHECYPISFLKQEGCDRVPAGDWVVVPYVRQHKQGPNLYGRDGRGFPVEWGP